MSGLSDQLARPTPHHRLVTSHHGHRRVHGGGTVGRVNRWVAIKVTMALGSMWAGYLFCLIAFVSFPQALHAFLTGDTVTGISWLSQSLIQLVALPVLAVGQRVLSEASDERAVTDHEILTRLDRLQDEQMDILRVLRDGKQ